MAKCETRAEVPKETSKAGVVMFREFQRCSTFQRDIDMVLMINLGEYCQTTIMHAFVS